MVFPEPPAPLRILSALYPDELSKLVVDNIVRWAFPEPPVPLRILSALYPDEQNY